MEFKNGYYEKIIENENKIKNLFKLREDCRNQWQEAIEKMDERMTKVENDFDRLTEKVDKKLNMLIGLILSGMFGAILHLLFKFLK